METSLAKIILDVELAKYAHKYYTPMTLNAESLALDVISKVGSGGEFVIHSHTRAHCRSEFSTPKTFNRMPYDQWIAKGSKDAKDLAHAEALRIIDQYEQPLLDSEIKKDIDLYVNKHWKS